MELDSQTHIYLESVSPGERHKHIYIYGHTPFCIPKKEQPEMVLFPNKKNGTTGLKFCMQAQLDATNNMRWIQLVSLGEGHKHINMATLFSVLKKRPKIVYQKKEWSTGQNYGMQTQLDSVINIGWVYLATPLPLCE